MVLQTIGTTALPVYGRNSGRLSLTMRNESTGGQKLYFWLSDEKGLTATVADYVLGVGEEKNLTFDTDGDDIRNPIAAVASAAGATLYKAETSIHRGA